MQAGDGASDERVRRQSRGRADRACRSRPIGGVDAARGRSTRTARCACAFPTRSRDALEAMIVNTAGGMAGGDRTISTSRSSDGRRARRHHRGGREGLSLARARRRDRGQARRSARRRGCAWLPQETILFDRARLTRRIEVDLRRGRLAADGRGGGVRPRGMGEAVRAGRVHRPLAGAARRPAAVRRDGAARRRDRARCCASRRSRPAASRSRPCWSCRAIDGDGRAVRARRTFWARSAMSAWNGLAVARLCAKDGAGLRRDLAAVLAALGGGAAAALAELRARR